MPPSDYKTAYETAKKELAELIDTQDRVGKRILVLRESLKMLATLCDSEEIQIEVSAEAEYILANSTLAQDIEKILKWAYPSWQRPNTIKEKLERLGHDLSKYNNPQAAIHMALKRMAESPNDPTEETTQDDGKKAYRCPALTDQLADAYGATSGFGAFSRFQKDLPESVFSKMLVAAEAAGIGNALDKAASLPQYKTKMMTEIAELLDKGEKAGNALFGAGNLKGKKK
jgi:hypothetical protein